MTKIIGIDPGSQRTGYGVIELDRQNVIYVASGIIKLPKLNLPLRLKIIFDDVTQIVKQYQPVEMAIEEVFLAKNPSAALKLGQSRGAAIVAAVHSGLEVFEYSARSAKKAVVGNGAANKQQVQKMVSQLLNLSEIPPEDAADALAVALCHGYSRLSKIVMTSSATSRYSRGRYQ